MGIEVIEMQHGVINKFVIAYNVPDVYPSQYMPSKLYLFTSFFKSNLFHKSIKKKSFDFGLSYCKSEQKKVVVSNKETFDFLLVSQPSVPDFINFALEIAALNPSYSFTYKIHPRELLNSSLVSNISNSAPQNFKISMDSSISKLMTEVDCIICIRSLVAYEAIQCGVNVLLTSPFEDSPMPDIDHFDNVYTIPSMMAVNLSEYVDLMPKGQRADMSKNILC